jgi:hypothetical protein
MGARRLSGVERLGASEMGRLIITAKLAVAQGYVQPRSVRGTVMSVAGGYEVSAATLPLRARFVGFLIVRELAVHLRHLNNITAYAKLGSASPGATGRIAYTRSYACRQSAVQLAGMSLYTLLLSAATWSPAVLGGAIGLAALAIEHARRAAASAPVTGPKQTAR